MADDENTCELKVGRLLEVRLGPGFQTAEEVASFFSAMGRVLQDARGSVVFIADWRAQKLMSPEVSDAVLDILNRNNKRVERSAILANDSALASLQMERLVREADNDHRRVFVDAEEATTWLAEILTLPEQKRLRTFLAE